MQKQVWTIIIILLLVVVVFAALNLSGGSPSELPFYIESFSSDRFLYHSREVVSLSLDVQSSEKLNGVLWIHGIYSSRDRINRREDVSLIAGLNVLTMDETLPSCTGCSGIRPGNYTITAVLTDSLNRSVSEKILVRIEQ